MMQRLAFRDQFHGSAVPQAHVVTFKYETPAWIEEAFQFPFVGLGLIASFKAKSLDFALVGFAKLVDLLTSDRVASSN